MIKPRVYLDTTVPSALLDSRAPERQELTKAFWQVAQSTYTLCASELTVQEIEDTPDSDLRDSLRKVIAGLDVLATTDDAQALADQYIARGILPERYRSDALHLAIATVHGIRLVASWNFRHIVRVATQDQVNFVNVSLGYTELEIASPQQL